MAAGMNTIDRSQRRAAAAALAFLIPMAFVIYANFGMRGGLLVAGDMAETVRRIAAREALFRLSVAFDLLYCAGVVALAAALYVVLSPVNRHLALLARLWTLVYAGTALLTALSFLRVVQLASDETYLEALGAGPLQAMVKFNWFATFTQYYVGLAFWALASTVFGWLWLKSRYVPAGLAIFGIGASAWCAFCASAYIINPAFKDVVSLLWFDLPMAVSYLALSIWLLIRGLPRTAPNDMTSNATPLAAP
jgi:Domain of unknown function (DUF4386)